MSGPDPAVAATRLAVRQHLSGLPQGALLLVACSGGPDSVALAAALAFEAPRAGLRAGAVVVDHHLQAGSDVVAADAAALCRGMGLDPVEVTRAHVPTTGAGLEADARTGRYAAISAVADRLGAQLVLVGHTRDDQAEQVLLGLSRGSGARSLSGMPVRRDRFVRPLLALPRATTEAACAAYGIEPWEDPHNRDESFRRVRARRLLASLEGDLGPGFGAALARSADLLREDADYLETLARRARSELPDVAGGGNGRPRGARRPAPGDPDPRLAPARRRGRRPPRERQCRARRVARRTAHLLARPGAAPRPRRRVRRPRARGDHLPGAAGHRAGLSPGARRPTPPPGCG